MRRAPSVSEAWVGLSKQSHLRSGDIFQWSAAEATVAGSHSSAGPACNIFLAWGEVVSLSVQPITVWICRMCIQRTMLTMAAKDGRLIWRQTT